MGNESINQMLERLAQKLKGMKEFTPPLWAAYAKTGMSRQRPPQNPDWWWVRAAALLRKIGTTGGLGVSRLRREYGGRKNRGHKPEHKFRGSGSVIRKLLQQLEAAGFVRKDKKKGRIITEKGTSFLKGAEEKAK